MIQSSASPHFERTHCHGTEPKDCHSSRPHHGDGYGRHLCRGQCSAHDSGGPPRLRQTGLPRLALCFSDKASHGSERTMNAVMPLALLCLVLVAAAAYALLALGRARTALALAEERLRMGVENQQANSDLLRAQA